MESQENSEIIKESLIALGFEEWKINIILSFANSCEQAIDLILYNDWDSIDLDSIKNEPIVQTENSINPESAGNNAEIIKNLREMIPGCEELHEKLMQDIVTNDENKEKIYLMAREMGFDDKNSRWAADQFDNLESAVSYLAERAKADELSQIKTQIYITAKEMGKDEATATKAGFEFDSLEDAIKFLSIEEEVKQSENITISQPNEEENSKKINETNQFTEETPIAASRSYTGREDEGEISSAINNEERSILNTQDSSMQNQINSNQGNGEFMFEDLEGFIHQGVKISNEPSIQPLYYTDYEEVYEEEECEEYAGQNLYAAENADNYEGDFNEENQPDEMGLEEFGIRVEDISEERKENGGERWISSEPININGEYVEGIDREHIMDILSNIIPVTGLSEEAKSRIVEFMYDGEILCKECVICCDKFEEKDVLYKLPCSHIFHKDCFLKYAERSESCPLDRQKI
ncbi:unnamed protein product [Blepharisma stoltei]|uniref:RING-type domain-containing protein n=1 Tax=Blepharisma stoltei TaxID=1481888 RepID=A0AAU9JKJ4_9CILI|nr:unnamed protein product [Blepharisma stoltei]